MVARSCYARSRVLLRSPRCRVDFLRQDKVPLPVLHAAADSGHALWQFVPGRPLADLVGHGEAGEVLWRRVGEAFAAVHSVKFPAPLRGSIGVDSLELASTSFVLPGSIRAWCRWRAV